MLNVIWLILKVIGIILAVLLGIILTAALLVFLVPIRYRSALVKTKESFKLEAKVSWLLHAVSIYFILEGKKKRIRLRILGKAIYDSAKKKKRRKRKKSSIKKTNLKESESKESRSKRIDSSQSDLKESKVKEEDATETKIDKTSEEKTSKEKTSEDNKNIESIKENKPEGLEAEENNKNESTASKPDENDHNVINEDISIIERLVNRLTCKLHEIVNKFKAVLTKIRGLFDNIEKLKLSLNTALSKLWTTEKKKLYLSSLRLIKKLIRHMLPRKVKGLIVFGTGDPYYTGQVFTYLGMAYGIYGKYLNISADFNEKKFEADIKVKGRIRMIVIFILLLRLYNKDMRSFIKEVKNMKV